MSKWVNANAFSKFVEKKKEEVAGNVAKTDGFFNMWNNPKMGKKYRVRLLPDPNGKFYESYYYHCFQGSDGKYVYIKCPKTDGMENFCPWCHISRMLYQGNDEDKKLAKKYNKQRRFVGNVFVVNDPRDADVDDEKYKATNTVKLYEFPATIEAKIQNEITNEEEGFGMDIFDPADGYDFILDIKEKAPDPNGKVWPSYDNCQFSRKKTSIAESEEEVAKIMENVYDISKYLENKSIGWEKQKEILKANLLWEDVESEFNKHVYGNTETLTKTEVKEDGKKEVEKEEPLEDTGDMNDQELLDELKNL